MNITRVGNKNCRIVSVERPLDNGRTARLELLYSYRTPVASRYYVDGVCCAVHRTAEAYSKTTARHVNGWVSLGNGSELVRTVPPQRFEFDAALFGVDILEDIPSEGF